MRLFLVDRIESVTVLKDRFELPENFTDDQLTGRAFGLVDENLIELKVLFSPEIAHLILERQWHPSQVVEKKPDGSVILSLSASGEHEILAWLYSYLPHVKVLAPAGLRKKFYDSLQQTLRES